MNHEGQFKSMWRKGEQPPAHVVDRAVRDIENERRAVTSSVLRTTEPDFKHNEITNAMRAMHTPVSEMGNNAPISGDYLSRAHHFKKAAMDYIWKMDGHGDDDGRN